MLINSLPPLENIFIYEQETSFINNLFRNIYYMSPLIFPNVGKTPPPRNYTQLGFLSYADGINWQPPTWASQAGYFMCLASATPTYEGFWWKIESIDKNGVEYIGVPALSNEGVKSSPFFPPKDIFTYEQKKEFIKNCYNTLYYISPFLNDNFGKSEPPVEYKKVGFLAKADGVNWNPFLGGSLSGTSGWFWWNGTEWLKLQPSSLEN